MKGAVTIFATLGLSLVFANHVFAETSFTDIGDSYAKNEIVKLADNQIIQGYPDNNFRPKNKINRQEFAVILAKALNLAKDEDAGEIFTDVDSWARPYVGALYKTGLTKGNGTNTFGAKDNLTREDLAVFFVRAMKLEEGANNLYKDQYVNNAFADRNVMSTYAKGDVSLAKAIGFIKGESASLFNPTANSDRQAVARLTYELIYKYKTVYIPNYIKAQMPEATSCVMNTNETYSVTLTKKGELLKDHITVSYEEAMGGLPLAYQTYRNLLTSGQFYTKWGTDEVVKSFLTTCIMISWGIDDSGVQLNPDNTTSSEARDHAIDTLSDAIATYKTTHPNQTPDENTLINIGIDSGVLLNNR